MKRILYPIERHDLHNKPLIFLAGPIKGAPLWQFEAIKYIHTKINVAIASPRRPELTEEQCKKHGHFWGQYTKYDQALWEHDHLKHAGQYGIIVFWLPKETNHLCQRAYAQTSRFELGWMMSMHKFANFRLIVGFESGFSNERYLRFTLSREAPAVLQCDSLEQTCDQSITFLGKM
jgi:hypothetical protein